MYKKFDELLSKNADYINKHIKPNQTIIDLICEYTYDGYKEINSVLRGIEIPGCTEEIRDAIYKEYKPLIDFISGTNLAENIIVFRGIHGSFVDDFVRDYKDEGMRFTEKGFMSTSFDFTIANFFKNKDNNESSMVLLIRFPKIKNAYYLEKYTNAKNEHEVLIKNATKFEVKSYIFDKNNNLHNFELEVV